MGAEEKARLKLQVQEMKRAHDMQVRELRGCVVQLENKLHHEINGREQAVKSAFHKVCELTARSNGAPLQLEQQCTRSLSWNERLSYCKCSGSRKDVELWAVGADLPNVW